MSNIFDHLSQAHTQPRYRLHVRLRGRPDIAWHTQPVSPICLVFRLCAIHSAHAPRKFPCGMPPGRGVNFQPPRPCG